MKTSPANLKILLQSNILEIKFVRRRPRPGDLSTRRMLCTNCRPFLNTFAARETFHFTPPTQPPKYNDLSKGLVVAFDLFMQQYRAINATAAEVLTIIPVLTQQQQEEFWKYFNQKILPMRTVEKTTFMNK